MFQIETFTQAHVSSVTNRVETHGDEKVPAVSIGLVLEQPNTILDVIDLTLRQTLYKAADTQTLPGVDESTPVLRCNSIESVDLPTKHEGWTLEVDDGIDETTPMTFGDVKVDRFVVEPKQGGTVMLRMRCGTSDIDAERLGKLGMHNGQDIWITLRAPKKAPEGSVIDGSVDAFKRDHPDLVDQAEGDGESGDESDAGRQATDAFLNEHGTGGDEAGGGADDAGEAAQPADEKPKRAAKPKAKTPVAKAIARAERKAAVKSGSAPAKRARKTMAEVE